ncbi:ATP-binding protein [Microbacterium invictum]|uniref:Helicase HerA central domain-containing protein n=1 Tax=Microbacterium invictum TaxID=515415 RepID=A0AA40SQK0_9MICO|nr:MULTISPECIES: ATP-binding protein [Microbacterium]MBB4140558.1 hypothetical protein [Microbacterium invictum]
MGDNLTIGTLLDSHDPAYLRAGKMNRHTFWVGQSGSGKTYALGVLLEQILLQTALSVVVLDPNSDFVHLGSTLPGIDPGAAGELAGRDIRVFGARGSAALQARYLSMPVRSRAAVIDVDPLHDADEYNAMIRFEERAHLVGQGHLVDFLRGTEEPTLHRLALRLENLGVADWDLWSWGGRSITEDIDENPDATVLDLGGFPTQAESRTAALAVLDHLWEHREQRIPRLIVIDEAHNLCNPDPATAVEALLTERIVQIAAEGRKYGLWLLLSTQRPSKVHPNALSQCDNLALMRMSSSRDLTELGEVFGFAPDDLVDRSPSFAQGQALFAGGFIDRPSLVQMGARLTREGGSDVKVPLR